MMTSCLHLFVRIMILRLLPFSEPLKNATAVGVSTSRQYAQVVVKNNRNAPGAEKYKKIAERQLSNGGYVICYDLTIDGTAFRYNFVAIKV